MHQDNPIDRYLRDVLRGSEVPLSERGSVADELRDHIDALTRRFELDGQDTPQAIESALCAFGLAPVVRCNLRAQQRRALWRTRWSESWRLFGYGALLLAVLAIVLVAIRGSGSIWWQMLQGLAFYAGTLTSTLAVCTLVMWLCPPIEVRLPRDELRLGQLIRDWLLTALAVIVGCTLLTLLVLGSATPLLAGPWPVLADDSLFLVRAVLGDFWREGAGGWLFLRAGAAIFIGSGVALLTHYLRSPAPPPAEAA